jgi:hypothetical protein
VALCECNRSDCIFIYSTLLSCIIMKQILFLLIACLMSTFASAQCSMCTKTAAGLDSHSAAGINMAIIYLALIPFSILLGILYYVYRTAKSKNQF